MGEAVGIVQAVDQCPAKVEVQAAVLAKDAKDGANRGLGLALSKQLHADVSRSCSGEIALQGS